MDLQQIVEELVAKKRPMGGLQVLSGMRPQPGYFPEVTLDLTKDMVSVDQVCDDPEAFEKVILVLPVVGDQIALWPIVPELGDIGHVGISIFPAEELIPRLSTAIDLLL